MAPPPPRRNGVGNVVHRIELPRRRWPARGRFDMGFPEGMPALAPLDVLGGRSRPIQLQPPGASAPQPPVSAAPENALWEAMLAQMPVRTPQSRTPQSSGRPGHIEELEADVPVRRRGAPVPEDEAIPAPQPVAVDPEKERAYQREIDLLERRLRKVQGLLDLREQELSRLIRAGKVDHGLASIYTEVQGLGDDTPMAEVKREMMASIFEANRELQARIKKLEAKPAPKRPGESGAA